MIICLCSGPLPYHYNHTIITSYWDTEKLQAICKINLQGVQRDSLLSSHTKIHVFSMILIQSTLTLYQTQFYYASVGSYCFQDEEQILRMTCKTPHDLSGPV